MQKIILVSPKTSPFTESVLDAFRKHGCDVKFFDNRKGIVYASILIRGLIRRFPVLKFYKRRHVRMLNDSLLQLTEQFKPDYMLVINGENIDPKTVMTIRKSGIKTANWFVDLLSHWPVIQKIAPAYDYFFSPDHHVLESLRLIGYANGKYLPLAVDDETAHTIPPDNKKYEVTFIGSYNPGTWTERQRLLETLKDFDLNIWGPKSWQDTSLNQYYHGEARGEKMFSIYRESKIVLDIPYSQTHFPADAVGPRPFEVMGSDACLFFHDVRKDMPRIFKEGREYVAFSTDEELRQKIKFYLADEAERQKIARAGHERVRREHTFNTRIKTILDILERPI